MLFSLALILPFLVAFTAAILYRYEYGVMFVFLWLFLGDFLRKLVPGQPSEMILLGDVVLFLTYFSFLAFLAVKKKNVWTPSFTVPLVVLVTLVLVGVFNPSSPGFLVGAVGLRSYLWFIPLMFLGYAMSHNKERVLKFIRVLAYASIPLFLLAAASLFLGDANPIFLKPFVGGHEIHSFNPGLVVRVSSLFGDAQRYGMISMFLFLLGLGLHSSSRKNTVERKFLFFATLSAFGGVVISASRSAFVLTVLGFFLFILISRHSHIRDKIAPIFSRKTIRKLFLLGGVLVLILLAAFQLGSGTGLFQLRSVYDVFAERIPQFIDEMEIVLSRITFFGHGTGTMSQGLAQTGQLSGFLEEQAYTGGETGIKKILFELGLFGFVIFYFFWGRLLYTMKVALNKIRDTDLKYIGLAVFIFLILILIRFTFIHHQVLGDTPVLILLWFFIGVFFKFGKLGSNREHGEF